MDFCCYWLGFPTQFKVLSTRHSSLISATIVFLTGDRVQVGLDRTASGESFIYNLAKKGLHYFPDKSHYMPAPKGWDWLDNYDEKALPNVIRRFPTITIPRSSTASRFHEMSVLQEVKEKKRQLLLRYGREENEGPAISSEHKRIYDEVNGQVDADVLGKFIGEIGHVIKWGSGEYSLHCYLISDSEQKINDLLQSGIQSLEIGLMRVNEERELPVR